MTMKKITTYIGILLLAAVLAAPGCSKKDKGADKGKKAAPAKPARPATPLQEARALLEGNGIDAATLKDGAADWTIIVESSDYADYDAHLVATWGMIFGTLGWYADESVTIINTLDGEPVLRISAGVDDILEMQQGVIDEAAFRGRWQYDNLD